MQHNLLGSPGDLDQRSNFETGPSRSSLVWLATRESRYWHNYFLIFVWSKGMLEKLIHVKSAIFILMTSGAASIDRSNPINYVNVTFHWLSFVLFHFASLHIPVIHSDFFFGGGKLWFLGSLTLIFGDLKFDHIWKWLSCYVQSLCYYERSAKRGAKFFVE